MITAVELREDLTRGTRLLLTAGIIAALTAAMRRRFRAQARWISAGGSLSTYVEDLLIMARISRALSDAHAAGWNVAAAELGMDTPARHIVTPQFLAGVDSTTAERLAAGKGFGIVERAPMIAQTEVGRAFNAGARALASEAGSGIEKAWLVQSGNPCANCLDAAADGFIPDEAPFSNGYFEPPGHPNCACSLSYQRA